MSEPSGPAADPAAPPRYLFVTGKLAESSVREMVASLAAEHGFVGEVAVVGITVAALIHADWLKRKLPREAVAGFDRVYLTGWVQGELDDLGTHYGVPFERGPREVADLPTLFGRTRQPADLSAYDIEILTEINHAPRLSDAEIVAMAARYRDDGGDVIDVGCIPGHRWDDVGRVVALLRSEGHRVSIDSFDAHEVADALAAGAELVLSCNESNADAVGALCREHDAEVVAIPTDPKDLRTLWPTVDTLDAIGCRYRLDAILEPIGFGFAESLARYRAVRERLPDAAMMMGVGNLTEMTGCDSAGVNMLLAAVCQEWGIRSVLTTEVINWGRTAVREFDLARRMVRHAIAHGTVPKHLSHDLVMLRDPRGPHRTIEELEALAASVRDPNYRLFVEAGEIHVINRDGHWRGRDAYELFDAFRATADLSAEHAFYLGYELCKAVTALTLGKRYVQDEALQWGFLTVEEPSARERRHRTDGQRRA